VWKLAIGNDLNVTSGMHLRIITLAQCRSHHSQLKSWVFEHACFKQTPVRILVKISCLSSHFIFFCFAVLVYYHVELLNIVKVWD